MSLAFQISNDDIETVLSNYGKSLPPMELEVVFDQIDDGAVESAALATDFDEDDDDDVILERQTDAAYDEIAAQLVEAGYISLEDVSTAGNLNVLRNLRIRGMDVPEHLLG